MNQSNVGVALAKEVCPVCLKESDGPILMNTKLTEHHARKVESLHGQVVGFSEEFCPECKEHAKEGVFFVGVDGSKTEDMNNPYRTGWLSCVKDEAVKRFMTEPMLSQVLKKRMCYIPDEVAMEIGLKPESHE